MHKPRPNIHDIELTSNLQRPTSNLQNYKYQLQEDEESSYELQTPPPELSHSSSRFTDIHEINKITVILILCIYIIDILALVSSVFSEKRHRINTHEIRNSILEPLGLVIANLKTDPIMDITMIPPKANCPYGFQPLKLANWPGTVAGCLCENGDFFNSTCEKVGSPKCKKDIPSTFPIEMYEWDGSIFCAKKATSDVDYVKKTKCPSNYKECYAGGCFKGDCPITKLEIASTGEPANQFGSKNKYLVPKRIPGELPLIEIQLTLGDVPCFPPDLVNQTIKNSSYQLSAVKENRCEKRSQINTELDSQTAYDSFIENSFPYSVMHLPHFEENSKSTTSVLSWMTRMKTAKNDSCLEIDERSTKEFLDHFIAQLHAVCAVFLLISHFFNPLMRLAAHLDGDPAKETYDNMAKCLFALHWVSYVQLLTELAWYNWSYLPFKTVKEDFQRYASLGCFDGNQAEVIISSYLEILNRIDADCRACFVIIVLNILPGFVFLGYFIVKKKFVRQ